MTQSNCEREKRQLSVAKNKHEIVNIIKHHNLLILNIQKPLIVIHPENIMLSNFTRTSVTIPEIKPEKPDSSNNSKKKCFSTSSVEISTLMV